MLRASSKWHQHKRQSRPLWSFKAKVFNLTKEEEFESCDASVKSFQHQQHSKTKHERLKISNNLKRYYLLTN